MNNLHIFDHLKIKKCAVIIPAFNEGPMIRNTIIDVLKVFSNVIVVDDGSDDDTLSNIKDLNIDFLSHAINLGQGAALQTGISYALRNPNVEFLITFDADGQHSTDSALQLFEHAAKNGLDVVLGSRFLSSFDETPKLRKFILKLGIVFTRLETGLKVTDTHNGLRIFSRRFAEQLVINQNGMAHASEILEQIKQHGLSWQEIPVTINYSDYSKSKGQPTINLVNILTELLHK